MVDFLDVEAGGGGGGGGGDASLGDVDGTEIWPVPKVPVFPYGVRVVFFFFFFLIF